MKPALETRETMEERVCNKCGRDVVLLAKVEIDSMEFDDMGKGYAKYHRIYYLCENCLDFLDSWLEEFCIGPGSTIHFHKPKVKDIWDLM